MMAKKCPVLHTWRHLYETGNRKREWLGNEQLLCSDLLPILYILVNLLSSLNEDIFNVISTEGGRHDVNTTPGETSDTPKPLFRKQF